MIQGARGRAWLDDWGAKACILGRFWAFLSSKRFQLHWTEGLACRNGGEAGLGAEWQSHVHVLCIDRGGIRQQFANRRCLKESNCWLWCRLWSRLIWATIAHIAGPKQGPWLCLYRAIMSSTAAWLFVFRTCFSVQLVAAGASLEAAWRQTFCWLWRTEKRNFIAAVNSLL